MTEHLAGFVKRLHDAGHAPQKIYDALVTRIAPKQARLLIYRATGCIVRKRSPSAEAKAKLSAARQGQPTGSPSRTTRKKIAAACKGKGRAQSQEARDKISAARKQKLAEVRATLVARVCARTACGAMFQPTTAHARYCSPSCRRIAGNARTAERVRLRRSRIKRYSVSPRR